MVTGSGGSFRCAWAAARTGYGLRSGRRARRAAPPRAGRRRDSSVRPTGRAARRRGEALGQLDDLNHLLVGEGEPGPQRRIEVGLQVEIVGNMQQRARRAHDDVAESVAHVAQDSERLGRIGPPDVASRNDTRHNRLAGERVEVRTRQIAPAPNQVEPHGLNRR